MPPHQLSREHYERAKKQGWHPFRSMDESRLEDWERDIVEKSVPHIVDNGVGVWRELPATKKSLKTIAPFTAYGLWRAASRQIPAGDFEKLAQFLETYSKNKGEMPPKSESVRALETMDPESKRKVARWINRNIEFGSNFDVVDDQRHSPIRTNEDFQRSLDFQLRHDIHYSFRDIKNAMGLWKGNAP